MTNRADLFPASRVLLVALFAGALALRLYHVDEPPLNFHATRQYRSLLIARAHYYDSLGSVSGSRAEIARINRERQGTLEPPILEKLVAVGYRLAGGERFWVPRVLSSIFWLVGGAFLYLIARRLVPSREAALLALAFYLFLPFAVVASRSFQPDGLMICLVLFAVWALLWSRAEPARLPVSVAMAACAAAILVKPVALFVLAGAVAGMEFSNGRRAGLLRGSSTRILAVSPLPSVVFYGWGMLTSHTLQQQARASFVPGLVVDRFFWKGWLGNLDDVIGLTTLFIAFVGVVVADRLCRHVLTGLWLGYGVFCVVFSYHIATHDYYHLQVVPIAALSIAPLVAVVAERLIADRRTVQVSLRVAALGMLCLALGVSAIAARGRLLVRSGLEDRPRIAAEIGRHVRHSTNTVYLSSDYGLPLEFHGELAGRPWPLVSDLEWERLAGMTPPDAEHRFRTDYAGDGPEYFIVADLPEFDRQPDLKRFLAANSRMLVADTQYVIYQLR